MPFSTPQQEDNSWKAPRGQDKEKLASVGLTGKLNLDSTWNSQEVQHEIRSLFQTTFCADGEEFVFSFLQCLPGGRKLIKPNTSVSFSWNGAEVINLAGQGALYILSHHNLPESEEHESPSKETLSFLSSTNSLTHQINLENDVQQLEQNVLHHRTPVVSAESLFNSIVTEHDDVNIFEDVPPLSTGSEVTTRTLAHSVDRSPESVIAELCSSVLADGVQNVKVRRNHAFQDLLRWMNRADYGWDKHLNVSFVGEQGLDSGGPRRNLMELTVRGLINWGGLWCGKEGHLIPAPDFLTLQNRSHCMAGRIVGTVLVQSSLQLNIFAESLINTIAGINQWFVEDVADETVQM
ncbi:uncharacterized protein LOC131736813 [Acipenser ruthenus]|uniref:uncharacterized protein LOC131736813 n=1 Tax=Acipenser ruthenus TaxID=7906 RepID=UPI002740AC1A|nr:uncharacterized protein LOC131736813 [Acipenser ruthenus]